MMNMPLVEEDLRRALEETPSLDLGVHLTLTAGSPLCSAKQVASLVDGEGKFFSLDNFYNQLDVICLDEVGLEWEAQVERFRSITGKPPAHLDSHHHTSYFNIGLFRLMLTLGQRASCALRARLPPAGEGELPPLPPERIATISRDAACALMESGIAHPDWFIGKFYGRGVQRETLVELINGLKEGVSELMCHPGYADNILRSDSTYSKRRELELDLLTDSGILALVGESKLPLITFGDLMQNPLNL